VIRLEDGDIVHEAVEELARKEDVHAGFLVAVGGADRESRLVAGPKDGRAETIEPMTRLLENVYEIAGTGTLFPDDTGAPVLHMHMACGREAETITGCIRTGVRVWQVMELVLYEILDTRAKRLHDPATGLKLLEPSP
jgi:predicted DNA-binding protein with PD1-like motif